MDTGKNILVVDDLATDRLALIKILKKQGFTNIVEASNGEEGVTKAKAGRPSLVFMDIVMPGISGFQATREIIKHDPSIPVIVVSTKDRAPDKMNANSAGAKGYIAKPISESGVVEMLQKYL